MPRHATTVALAVALLLAFLTPNVRELFVGDETKYSQIVREMVAGGNWFLPTLEGTPFTHKPPVHYWMIGIFTFALGTYSVWAYVLPSLLAFAVLAWLMWRHGGPMAAFVCATSLLIWGSAQSARMDVAFTTLIAVGAWRIARFFDESRGRDLLIASVALGAATLIKGPMAPVIGVVLFALEAWRRRSVPRGPYVASILILAAIPLLWFVPATLMGGDTYTNEVLKKQLAGRAVGSWVHRSPPWYYLLHSPGFLFPWFGAAIVAIVKRWREERFLVSWILAVLIPYTLMSSKLDVYMMALIPPVALLIAKAVDLRGVRIGNVITLIVLAVIAVAGLLIPMDRIPEADRQFVTAFEVRGLFVVLLLAALAGIVSSRGDAKRSMLALGLTPLAAFAWVAIVMMPAVNELATTAPLVRALEKQGVASESIALYRCPHLWTRSMPRELERVRYVSAESLASMQPSVIATHRSYAKEIEPSLRGYRKVDEVRMIGKWFDVYRR